MVRAAVDGVVDFSNADLMDPRWHKRLSLVIDEMDRKDELKFYEALHRRYLTFLLMGSDSVAIIEGNAKKEKQAIDRISDIIFMTEGNERDTQKATAIWARKAWAQAWGDPSDPEVRSNIDAIAAGLRAQREANKAKGS